MPEASMIKTKYLTHSKSLQFNVHGFEWRIEFDEMLKDQLESVQMCDLGIIFLKTFIVWYAGCSTQTDGRPFEVDVSPALFQAEVFRPLARDMNCVN